MAEFKNVFQTASDKYVGSVLAYAKAADHKLYYESAYTNEVTKEDAVHAFLMGTLMIVSGDKYLRPVSVNDNIFSTLIKTGASSDAFDATDTYSVGDFVTKDGKVYKCKTAIQTAAAWDATKWDEVVSCDIVEWITKKPANS